MSDENANQEATRLMQNMCVMPGFHGTVSAEVVDAMMSRFDDTFFVTDT